MASITSPTATLCHWVCSTQYGDLPAEVCQETRTLLYDQVGCMIASATLPSCQPVVALVRRLSPPGACSIVGHSEAEIQQKFRDLVGLRLQPATARFARGCRTT
jgi:2-methylcitrate dehydratase PrpD